MSAFINSVPLALIVIAILVVLLVGAVVALCWLAAVAADPGAGDDWMDIADVISDDHHPDGCGCDGIPLEGFTPAEQGVLERNWLPLTDDERNRLNDAFRAVVEGADR